MIHIESTKCMNAIFARMSYIPTILTFLLELKLKRQPLSALLATSQNAKHACGDCDNDSDVDGSSLGASPI
jgi:hypothetical protein